MVLDECQDKRYEDFLKKCTKNDGIMTIVTLSVSLTPGDVGC